MNGEQFRAWRKQMKWSQEQAATELGVNRTTVRTYEHEQRPDGKPFSGIPRNIALACRALFHRLPPWGE